MAKEKTHFQKGNPGRPRGSRNKNATRTELSGWIDNNFGRFTQEMGRVKGAKFCELYIKAMEFVMPRYSAISFSLRNMSEDDLSYLIDKLKDEQNEVETD